MKLSKDSPQVLISSRRMGSVKGHDWESSILPSETIAVGTSSPMEDPKPARSVGGDNGALVRSVSQIISKSRGSRQVTVLGDISFHVIIHSCDVMHSFQVLPEVVGSWPSLAFRTTARDRALVECTLGIQS